MNSIEKLTKLFADLPGVGPRQAKRFVYFLLHKNPQYAKELSDTIATIKQDIVMCTSCHKFFPVDASHSTVCSICRDINRDRSTLMIVGRDVDCEHIEKTHSFNGLYFILGGTIPILDQEPEKRIRSKQLLDTITTRAEKDSEPLTEIILALNANPEGEHTADHIKQITEPLAQKYSIKVSTLGKGLSTGTELEYSDADTLKNALKNRV